MSCERCGGEIDEMDGVCTQCQDHRYPYVIERGQFTVDGDVVVERCPERYCVRETGECCRHLKGMLPTDSVLMVVYCDPVYRGEVMQ